MKLSEAIHTFGDLPEADCHALLDLLLPREREAILSECRLDEAHWHEVLKELSLLPPKCTDNCVRLAISVALLDVVLAGPVPDPLSGPCERVASFSDMVGYCADALKISPSQMQEHFENWSNPSAPDPLRACHNLIRSAKEKPLLTGRSPSWAIPFAVGDSRPLNGCSAKICHGRLGLYPEVDTESKLVMTYVLPSGTRQAIPTIGDAYRWNDESPHWRSFFMPAAEGSPCGFTVPASPGLDGLPEIVHSPVSLIHLIHPLERRH